MKSNLEITHEEAKSIVEDLPKNLRGPWEDMGRRMDQAIHGWNAACDIHEPTGKEWRIGGSYSMSGHIAEEMAEHLKHELNKREHQIEFDKNG